MSASVFELSRKSGGGRICSSPPAGRGLNDSELNLLHPDTTYRTNKQTQVAQRTIPPGLAGWDFHWRKFITVYTEEIYNCIYLLKQQENRWTEPNLSRTELAKAIRVRAEIVRELN